MAEQLFSQLDLPRIKSSRVGVASRVFVEWLMGVQPEQGHPVMGPEMGVGTKGLNPDAGIHQEQMERSSVAAVGISRGRGRSVSELVGLGYKLECIWNQVLTQSGASLLLYLRAFAHNCTLCQAGGHSLVSKEASDVGEVSVYLIQLGNGIAPGLWAPTYLEQGDRKQTLSFFLLPLNGGLES